jgi:CHAD domain-containing protein
MTPESLYTAAGLEPSAIVRQLERLLRVRSRVIPPHRVICLDTFDGRIAASGGQLLEVEEGATARLEWHRGARRLRARISGRMTAAFVWDLPPGAVATQLRSIVGVRRLLPMVELELDGHTLDVFDDRGKTAARITITAARARRAKRGRWHAVPALVTVAGLPGHDEESRHVRTLVERRPGLQRSREGLQALGLRAVGATLPPDSSQVGLGLPASLRADAGAAEVHRRLVAVMRANEAGLRDDLDTEFLHDYRVALRRTRSLLGQIKNVFPADRVERFREEFGWLGAVTGPARDLDVLMLALRPIPDDPGGDIPALRRDIAEHQRRAHRAMLKHLDSPRCRRLFADWARFLAHTSPASLNPAGASRPFADVVSSRVWRLYRRLNERAALVTDHSTPTALHEIRIAAKKLRYVADLTRSIQEGGAVDDVIAVLKKLQTVLGDYNDTVVHERLLQDEGRVLVEADPERVDVLASIGNLVEQLRARRASLRPRVLRELRRLCSQPVRSEFRHSFKAISRAAAAGVGDRPLRRPSSCRRPQR